MDKKNETNVYKIDMSKQDTTIKDYKFGELSCIYTNNLLYLCNFNKQPKTKQDGKFKKNNKNS